MLHKLNISFSLFIALIGMESVYSCTCPNKASGAFYDCDLPVSVYANKKRYLMSDILTMNWYESLGHCRAINMQLGAISDTNELEILKTAVLPGEKYWLSGFLLYNVSGNFMWLSSGKKVSYEFLPASGRANGGCIVITDAGLASGNCNQELPFICEQFDG